MIIYGTRSKRKRKDIIIDERIYSTLLNAFKSQ